MKLAYCGDDCEECPRYIATLSGSKEKLKEAAVLMKKVGWRYDLETPENMKCRGCQDIEICEYNVKECCIEKKISNCGECTDYPCYKINKTFEITRINTEKFKDILTKEEYELFNKAFFSKKENLDNIKF
ncbi:MAG: DUF3795 domain-containing protein [Candidatus Hermodarchaeota archaeon]